jgi:hypothetical protein
VVLDGRYAASGDGLRITSNGNVIKGLQIIRFPDDGVEITDGAKHNVIGGDWMVDGAPHGELLPIPPRLRLLSGSFTCL